jgi:hypothetical protein
MLPENKLPRSKTAGYRDEGTIQGNAPRGGVSTPIINEH